MLRAGRAHAAASLTSAIKFSRRATARSSTVEAVVARPEDRRPCHRSDPAMVRAVPAQPALALFARTPAVGCCGSRDGHRRKQLGATRRPRPSAVRVCRRERSSVPCRWCGQQLALIEAMILDELKARPGVLVERVREAVRVLPMAAGMPGQAERGRSEAGALCASGERVVRVLARRRSAPRHRGSSKPRRSAREIAMP